MPEGLSIHATWEVVPLRETDVLYVVCSAVGLVYEFFDFLFSIDFCDQVEHRAIGELALGDDGEEIRFLRWLDDDRSRFVVVGMGLF